MEWIAMGVMGLIALACVGGLVAGMVSMARSQRRMIDAWVTPDHDQVARMEAEREDRPAPSPPTRMVMSPGQVNGRGPMFGMSEEFAIGEGGTGAG